MNLQFFGPNVVWLFTDQSNQREGDKSVKPTGQAGPALHTLNFLRKWISGSLHPAATNADNLNCIWQPWRKNKLHFWSVQKPEHGHQMFPNSGIKEFHLNALKHLFSLNPICQTINGTTLITESVCLPTTSISQSTEFKLQQKILKTCKHQLPAISFCSMLQQQNWLKIT